MKTKIHLGFIFFFLLFVSCVPTDSWISCDDEQLIALNKNAIKTTGGSYSKQKISFYKFTQEQKNNLEEIKALKIIFGLDEEKIKNADTLPFSFGWIYSDSVKNENLMDAYSGNLLQLKNNKISLTVNLKAGKPVPSGFYLVTRFAYKIYSVQTTEPKLGFDLTGEVPEYAIYNEDSLVLFDSKYFDFRGASTIFGGNQLNKIINVKVEDYDANSNVVVFSWGRQKFMSEIKSFLVQGASVNENDCAFSFNDNDTVLKCLMSKQDEKVLSSSDKVLYPIKTDLGLIMNWNKNFWRTKDYELFEWESFPGILFFDFANYNIQNLFFTRLAYFIEKAGYKGTLVDDDFVRNKHGYNAHDYSSYSLAKFFNEVKKQNFKINYCEKLLKEILIANKIIIQNDDGSFDPGSGAVISFSRESPDYLRQTFLSHESWHGVYFVNTDFKSNVESEFQRFVRKCYNEFDPLSMEFLQTFWETQNGLGYDRTDDYLMQTEFLSYIMQQSLKRVGPYFDSLTQRGSVQRNQKEQADYVHKNNAQAFVDAAIKLDEWTRANFGIGCGDVENIRRLN